MEAQSWAQVLWGCPMVSGIRVLEANPLSYVGCEMGFTLIRLIQHVPRLVCDGVRVGGSYQVEST